MTRNESDGKQIYSLMYIERGLRIYRFDVAPVYWNRT